MATSTFAADKNNNNWDIDYYTLSITYNRYFVGQLMYIYFIITVFLQNILLTRGGANY